MDSRRLPYSPGAFLRRPAGRASNTEFSGEAPSWQFLVRCNSLFSPASPSQSRAGKALLRGCRSPQTKPTLARNWSRQPAGIAQDESVLALKPAGPASLHDIDEVYDANDRAEVEFLAVRRMDAPRKPRVRSIGRASVNEEWSSVRRGPGSVFDVLPTKDDRPRPGLLDRDHLHRPCVTIHRCRPNTEIAARATPSWRLRTLQPSSHR